MNYLEGDSIMYLDPCNNKHTEYKILDVYKSFIVCKQTKSGKIKHIYKEFFKNIEGYKDLKVVRK